MAQYIKREMPDLHGKGSKQVCYRLKSNGTVDLGDLARECARGTTFAEGEMKGVVMTLLDGMVRNMTRGFSVHIRRRSRRCWTGRRRSVMRGVCM